MKPLPPLRTTFDGGGDLVRGGAMKGSAAAEKPTTSSSSSNTPALTYDSAFPSSGAPSTSAASVPNMRLPLAQEWDKPYHVERQRGRRTNNNSGGDRGETEINIPSSLAVLPQRSRWVNTVIREDEDDDNRIVAAD
ncbi:MAG: hypothetical protein LQ352_002974 [Teloschistes flavicans]|nr:MAG: hypothetical protein LQ352_002974 [Teloschistes flavicans]